MPRWFPLKRRDPEHHAHEPSSFEFADPFPGPATAYVTAPPLSPRPRRTRRRAAQGFAEVVLRERTEHLQAQVQYQAAVDVPLNLQGMCVEDKGGGCFCPCLLGHSSSTLW